MTASLEIYDSGLTDALDNNIFVGDVSGGTTYAITTCKVRNDGDSDATNIRLFARCLNGLYTGQENELGQEAMTEQWVEVSVAGGAYDPIGGNFAGGTSPSPAGNYISLSDLSAGSASDEISFHLNVPSSISSAGSVIIQLGVSYKE